MTENKHMNPVVSVIVILILIILVLAVILGFQFRRSHTLKLENDRLNTAYTQLESSLESRIKEATDQASSEAAKQTRAELETEYEEKLAAAEQALQQASESPAAAEEKDDWMKLEDFPRLSVKPDTIYDEPLTMYIAASTGLNMRSGPGESYAVLTSANRATRVQAAAEQGEWTLIVVGDQAGWAKTSFLSDRQPSA